MPSAQEMLRHGPGRFGCVMARIWNKLIRNHVTITFHLDKRVGYFRNHFQKRKNWFWIADIGNWTANFGSFVILFVFRCMTMYDVCMLDSATFRSGTLDWQLYASVEFPKDHTVGVCLQSAFPKICLVNLGGLEVSSTAFPMCSLISFSQMHFLLMLSTTLLFRL